MMAYCARALFITLMLVQYVFAEETAGGQTNKGGQINSMPSDNDSNGKLYGYLMACCMATFVVGAVFVCYRM